MIKGGAVKEVGLLLVEDDDADARTIERGFKKARLSNPLVRARDGREALEILQGAHPDKRVQSPYIVLLDLSMPGMNGLEFLKVIRNRPELRELVVFVLTSSDDEQDIREAYHYNVAGYIIKSSAGQDFLEILDLLDKYWRVVELPVLDAREPGER